MTTTPPDRYAWQDLAGAPPPRVLHNRLIRDPEEVLILTYTCDLAFVEDVGVRQAHAAGARVTVVYDADHLQGAHGTAGPIEDYVPVPVLCRSGGAFHPKLVVIASATDAIVSIGSGNATTAGWHHNAEIWTHIRADGPTVPTLVGDLADWLHALPDQLWTDPLGRDRLHAVADLLTTRPVHAQPNEPRLLVNDQTALIDQLPPPTGPVDRLAVASPFFDPPARALSVLIHRVRPAQVGLLLTRDVQCDPNGIDRVLSRVSDTSVATPVGTRYHHGKAIEWWSGPVGTLITGSANCTQAALTRAMPDSRGNCELALLQQVSESLLATVEARDSTLDDPELRVRDGDDEERRAAPRLRVIALRLLTDRVEATLLVSAGPAPEHLVIELAGQPHTLPHTAGHPPLHTYNLAGPMVHDARTATVHTDSGELIGDALVTDVQRALTRITHPSPLEATPLHALIQDQQQLDALFNALADLATLRMATTGASDPAASRRRTHQEERIRGVVGPAMLNLALGRDTNTAPPLPDDDTLDPDDTTTTATAAALGRRHAARAAVQRGAADPPTTVAGAVAIMDRRRRQHLQRRITSLITRATEWSLPAQLATFRIVLILTAAGLWSHPQDWARVVCSGLENLWSAEEDDAFAHEHAALATIGLAALRHGQLSCASDRELADAFDEFRAEYHAYQDWLRAAPDDLFDRYTAGLRGTTFGPLFNTSNIRDDIAWILTRNPVDDAMDDAVDAIADTIGPAERCDGSVTVHTVKNPRRALLAALDQLRDFPDTHVVIHTAGDMEHHGWWNGRRLLLLTPASDGWQAAVWPTLLTGIASYATGQPLPQSAKKILVTTVDKARALLGD